MTHKVNRNGFDSIIIETPAGLPLQVLEAYIRKAVNEYCLNHFNESAFAHASQSGFIAVSSEIALKANFEWKRHTEYYTVVEVELF